jgi:hypothetical protein
MNLGVVASFYAEYEKSLERHEESLSIFREIDNRMGVAISLHNLANVAFRTNDISTARDRLSQSLALRRAIGDQLGTALALEGFAAMTARADPVRGAQIWGAAERFREQINAPLTPDDRERYDAQIADTVRESQDDRFRRAWQRGRSLSVEQAIQLALERLERD